MTSEEAESLPFQDSVEPNAAETRNSALDVENPSTNSRQRRRFSRRLYKIVLAIALIAYIGGLGSGYLFWGRQANAVPEQGDAQAEIAELAGQINPKEGYRLLASYGSIGPMLVQSGVIDLVKFKQLYEEIGRPLTPEQLAILTEGSHEPVVITTQNQHFLLNLLWAFGLANQNRILTEGPMMRKGKEGAMHLASTGGWSLAKKPVSEIYAHSRMVDLTEDQQQRLEDVSGAIYRPSCDNPTNYPD